MFIICLCARSYDKEWCVDNTNGVFGLFSLCWNSSVHCESHAVISGTTCQHVDKDLVLQENACNTNDQGMVILSPFTRPHVVPKQYDYFFFFCGTLKNIFWETSQNMDEKCFFCFCFPHKNVTQVWNHIRASEWWQHFWVEYLYSFTTFSLHVCIDPVSRGWKPAHYTVSYFPWPPCLIIYLIPCAPEVKRPMLSNIQD